MKCSGCETVLNILVFSLKRKGADAEESRFEVWKMKIDNVTSVGEILSLVESSSTIYLSFGDLPVYIPVSTITAPFIDILVSLFTFRERVNMDKLLNRGKYSIKKETKIIDEKVKPILKIFGIGKEFTIEDKIIYLVSFVWNIFFTLVFVFGTIYNLYNDVSDESWMLYWKYQIYINIVFSFIIIIWFTIGGFFDIKKMFISLGSDKRDHGDSGWVEN